MNTVTAILSLLHQPAEPSSLARRFRGEPVMAWTLRRLSFASQISQCAILCWEDQFSLVKPLAAAAGAFVLAKGPRHPLPMQEAIATAQAWADGWRGGLLGTCHYDVGFHAEWCNEIRGQLHSDAVLLVSPDAALVDAVLLDRLIEHARRKPGIEFCFTPAAPGLCGLLLRSSLLERMAALGGYPGRLLSYAPDLPGGDPLSRDECAPVPTSAARTLHRFTIDSDRQRDRVDRATECFNGTLMQTEAEHLVAGLARLGAVDRLPRDIVLELNTSRATRPVYSPAAHLSVARPDLPLDTARQLFCELAQYDDIRVTLAGVGDPLLAECVIDVIELAREAGIRSMHLETDLAGIDVERLQRLAQSPLDLLSVHLPATSASTYAAVMGTDELSSVIENLKMLATLSRERKRATPLIIPTFIKCGPNLHEMENWYDYWLRTLGCAVILGPSSCAGQIPDAGVADMRPPRRVACRRLATRLTVLSDGRIVSCEQDVLGRQVIGRVGTDRIGDVWRGGLDAIRSAHAAGEWDRCELCRACCEWHRP